MENNNLDFERLQAVYSPKTPKILQWIIKFSKGRIKNERQASYVLLSVVFIFIVISVIIFIAVNKKEVPQGFSKPPGTELYEEYLQENSQE